MKILKFYKPGCEPCRALAQILTLTHLDVAIENVDVTAEENKPLVEQYGIKAVPVLLMLPSGSRLIGVKPSDVIEEWAKDETD